MMDALVSSEPLRSAKSTPTLGLVSPFRYTAVPCQACIRVPVYEATMYRSIAMFGTYGIHDVHFMVSEVRYNRYDMTAKNDRMISILRYGI